jgi:acyl-CoA synthetase (AMP-forming)/AMP-acid ligase II
LTPTGSFAESVFEIFGALLSGAELHVISRDKLMDPRLLASYIKEQSITIWHSVPTLMSELLLVLKNAAGYAIPSTIRRVMIGGEAWSVELAKNIREIFSQAVIVNMYGPTEATIWVSSYTIGEEIDNLTSIPIGKPIANNKILILDSNRKLCGIGIPGDIYISGANITKGYNKDEQKTKEVFIKDEATGEIMKVNTLFPSKQTNGETKGGIVLLKLKKLSDDAKLTLTTSYEDRNGKKDSDSVSIAFDKKDGEYYENNGIRKGILLARYANMMKTWILDEQNTIQNTNSDKKPSISETSGIIIPNGNDKVDLNKWEHQSTPLKVSASYKKLFESFSKYFENEMKAIGDNSLSRELEILNKLSK